MPSNASTLQGSLDFSHRAQLTEMMDEPCSRDELRACLRDLERLNRWFFGYRPLLHFLNHAVSFSALRPIRILDVGCGHGEGVRRVALWARKHGIAVELTGLDINPDAVAIAAETSPAGSTIHWVSADIFAYVPREQFDFVASSLFTHHLSNSDVIRFLRWMEHHANLGWFVNDLSRALVPYHLLRVFTKLARLHRFVQHDGPVSIARSFVTQDWQWMCAEAGLEPGEVIIQGFKPARLCVSRKKSA